MLPPQGATWVIEVTPISVECNFRQRGICRKVLEIQVIPHLSALISCPSVRPMECRSLVREIVAGGDGLFTCCLSRSLFIPFPAHMLFHRLPSLSNFHLCVFFHLSPSLLLLLFDRLRTLNNQLFSRLSRRLVFHILGDPAWDLAVKMSALFEIHCNRTRLISYSVVLEE